MRKHRKQVIAAWILLGAILLGCRSRPYDFGPYQASLNQEIPIGSTPERALAVLDSVGIPHSGYSPTVRKIVGSLREPDPKMIFGTLRVVLTFDENRTLVDREIRVVYTGP